MRFALSLLLLLATFSFAQAAIVETCESHLSSENIKAIFLNHAASPWLFSGFKGTPLEVSAYLRPWKAELARKLGIQSEEIAGNFRRGSLGFEENSRSGKVRLLMVRTLTGVRGIVVLEADLKRQLLKYLDPAFPRPLLSSIFEYTEEGRPSFHISALEDPMDCTGISGNLVGVLTLKVPGLHF